MSSDKYYVYEYVRLDTNEPFYIGKGKGNRWKSKQRNKYFKNIAKNTPIACIILHDSLDQDTAFEYECWYIWQLRDVQGYNLVNRTDGGEGIAGYKWTKEQKQKISEQQKGKNNSFYGKTHSNESLEKIINSLKGKNNPMYGKSMVEVMGEERYNKYGENFKNRKKPNISGKNNPMYGKAGNIKKVVLVDKDENIIKEFENVKEAVQGDWRFEFPKPNGRPTLEKCLKQGLPFHGFYLKYEEDFINEQT